MAPFSAPSLKDLSEHPALRAEPPHPMPPSSPFSVADGMGKVRWLNPTCPTQVLPGA